MMNEKNNFQKINYILLLIGLGIIFCLNLNGLYQENQNHLMLGLLLNLLLLLITVAYFKIDYMSFLILCVQALLVPATIQYFTGQSYGILNAQIVPVYLPYFIIFNFVYCILIIVLAIIFNFRTDEIKLVNFKSKSFNNINIITNNVIAVLFTIVAFPRLSLSTSGETRFNMLLPGHAWNQLAIVALIFNYPYLKKRSVKLTYLFVVLWFLLNGERADVTGLIFGLIILNFMTKKPKSEKSRYIALAILAIGFMILLNAIVIARSHQKVTLATTINSLLTTPTTSDVSYLFTATIDAWKNSTCLHGQIFKSDLVSIIPFSNPNGFDYLIRQLGYFSPGGEPFLAQPILDWGPIGLIFRAIIDFTLFKLLTIKVNSFFYYEFITLLCLVPRMTWYGRNYVFSSLIFFVPILYVINYYFLKKFRLGV